MLKQRILDYDELHSLDRDYLAQVIASNPVEEVLGTLAELLATRDRETVLSACAVIRDLGILKYPAAEFQTHFRKTLPQSPARDELEQCLYRDEDSSIRSSTIYTLGKLVIDDFESILRDSWSYYYANDPLNIHRLLFEISMYGGEIFSLAEKLTLHSDYLFRWAGLEALASTRLREEASIIKLYERLMRDPRDKIRVLATHDARRLEAEARGQPFPPGDHALSFSNFEVYVGNSMHMEERANSSLPELREYAERFFATENSE